MATNRIQTTMGWTEWLMLIGLSVLWGGSYFFVEIALTEVSSFRIVTLRVTLAALVIWAFVFAKRYPVPKKRSAWLGFIWMGILNNVVPFNLIVWGQIEVASGLAAILNAAAPIFTVLVAGLWLKDEPVTLPRLIGALLGLGGVAVLIGPSAIAGLDANLIAQLAILAAALSYAFAGVYGRRFTAIGVHPIVAAAGQLAASSAIMVLLTLVFDRPLQLSMPGADVWAAILALAVFCTAVAYVLYFRLLERAGATNMILVTLLIPISAILLGSAFLGERLQTFHFVGIGIIAVGLSVIDGRLWRRFFR